MSVAPLVFEVCSLLPVEHYLELSCPFPAFNMAPALIESIQPVDLPISGKRLIFEDVPRPNFLGAKRLVDYKPGRTVAESHDSYEHEDLRPSFPNLHWAPLSEVPYQDKGLRGDSRFRNLLASATDVFDYNPKIGTEIHGVNLASLTNAQKNDLARLISIRGVVFFRNQTDLDIDAQRELGAYFGKLHKHATTAVPRRAGLEDVHVVYTDGSMKDQRAVFSPTFLWHSDVSTRIVRILNSANEQSGNLRAATAIIHLPEAAYWTTSRRWRRHTLGIAIRSL